jgi:ABC-type nitrate/sulfonate/bicarbonate transport system substrate-binding protein
VLGLIVLLQALTVVMSGPATSPEYLPLRVAEAEGYFARENLAVTLRMTRAEPGAAEALAQGQADLAATSLDAILRFGPRAGNQSARLVFGLTAAPPVVLVVPASQTSLVKSIESLPGTRVGLSTPGAPEQAWFAWLLAKWGLSVADVWIVSHGSRGLASAMETGDVHAGLMHEPQATRLLGGSEALVLADLRTPGAVKDALGALTVNAAVFMRADRRVSDQNLQAFARAMLAAERRIAAATPQALAARLAKSVTVPADDFETRLAATRGGYLMNGLVSAEQLQETLSLIRAHQPMPATARLPRPEDMLHLAPLRRALTAGPR